MRRRKIDTSFYDGKELASYFVNPETARIFKKMLDDFDPEICIGPMPRPDFSPENAMKLYKAVEYAFYHVFEEDKNPKK